MPIWPSGKLKLRSRQIDARRHQGNLGPSLKEDPVQGRFFVNERVVDGGRQGVRVNAEALR